MASLRQRSQRLWLALVLALGLTVLPGLVAPLLGDELANQLPGTTVVLADEPQGGGG